LLDQQVEIVLEEGQDAARVGEDEVVVVGEHAVGVEQNAVAGDSAGEAVEDDGVDLGPGTEEVTALGAAARDEVAGSGDDTTGSGHTSAREQGACQDEWVVMTRGW
jgi:hypothetical protein